MISRGHFTTYRVLALTVGVLLLVSCLFSLAAHLLTQGSSLQQVGEKGLFIWAFHGWCYIVYVVVAFVLARKAGFGPARILVLFIAGLVPLLMFFVEHKTAQDLKATHPELA